eukprot:48687-Eustigmatos_ZCMA.PRE.1
MHARRCQNSSSGCIGSELISNLDDHYHSPPHMTMVTSQSIDDADWMAALVNVSWLCPGKWRSVLLRFRESVRWPLRHGRAWT